MGGAITNLEGEARRAGRHDRDRRTRVDAAYVRSAGADVVLVATGAVPYRPPLELMGTPLVLDAWEVLRGAEVPLGTVVVADWRCDWVGLGLATMLSTGGRRVVLASSGYFAGQRVQQYVRDQMTIAARKARVDMRSTLRPFGADDTTVYLQDVLTGEAVIVEDAVALVLATGHVPDGALLEELTAMAAAEGGLEVRGIGDVLGPRTIEEAVLDGLRAAVSI